MARKCSKSIVEKLPVASAKTRSMKTKHKSENKKVKKPDNKKDSVETEVLNGDNDSKNPSIEPGKISPNSSRLSEDSGFVSVVSDTRTRRSECKGGKKNNEKTKKKDGELLSDNLDEVTTIKQSKTKNVSVKSLRNEDKDVNMMNVEELLALGENKEEEREEEYTNDEGRESDSSCSDFEEVKDAKCDIIVPKDGIKITVDMPEWNQRKKKRKIDIREEITKQFNRVRKIIQIRMHKVHLLCWLGHCLYMNKVLNSDTVTSLALSTLQNSFPKVPKTPDVKYLENFLKWFSNVFNIKDVSSSTAESVIVNLLEQFSTKIVSKQNAPLIFISMLRFLGFQVRLVMSLQVLPLKPIKNDFMKLQTKKVVQEQTEKEIPIETTKTTKNMEETKKKSARAKKLKLVKYEKSGTENESEDENKKKVKKPPVKRNLRKRKNTIPVLKSQTENSSSDSDSEFKLKVIKKIKKLDRRVLSTDEEDTTTTTTAIKKKQGVDIWVEVYLENVEKWVCVDVIKSKVDCISELCSKASQPVLYVIGCNNDSTLKDVTRRYVTNWHTDTRRQRVEPAWWDETLSIFTNTSDEYDEMNEREEKEIMKRLSDQQLPTSISQFKNHPLYVLKRHLLKFEAIYPVDAPTFGFIRGEAIFARECVHVLRSREKWYKEEARVVRAKSDPYKTVQTTKYDKVNQKFYRAPLDLYGLWQTDEYDPPTAVDGKVPRNEYGNVELFKPCMLPRGTVHLQNPGLIKIARKLNIDWANAVVGFEFHCNACHPVYDGIVVCEEFKDNLLTSWEKDVEESARRAEEKRDKRIYGNWKKLIRGLLITQKLKLKYSFGGQDDEDEDSDDDKPLIHMKK